MTTERAGGGPLPPDYTSIDPETGQQKAYLVLAPEERAKGFVEPVRRSYVHLVCGVATTMGRDIAETYARDPGFYSGTFCGHCRAHFPLVQFVWEGTQQVVGTRAALPARGASLPGTGRQSPRYFVSYFDKLDQGTCLIELATRVEVEQLIATRTTGAWPEHARQARADFTVIHGVREAFE